MPSTAADELGNFLIVVTLMASVSYCILIIFYIITIILDIYGYQCISPNPNDFLNIGAQYQYPPQPPTLTTPLLNPNYVQHRRSVSPPNYCTLVSAARFPRGSPMRFMNQRGRKLCCLENGESVRLPTQPTFGRRIAPLAEVHDDNECTSPPTVSNAEDEGTRV